MFVIGHPVGECVATPLNFKTNSRDLNIFLFKFTVFLYRLKFVSEKHRVLMANKSHEGIK